MTEPPEIAEGAAMLALTCPECGRRTAPLMISLGARLVVDDSGGTLRPVLRAKPVDHECRTVVRTVPLFELAEAEPA